MQYTELKNSIAEGAKPVYLLQGVDAYFRKCGEEMIVSAFLQYPELNLTAFDGTALKGEAIKSLANALKVYPFMSEKRIVKVTDFYPTEKEYTQYLEPLFSNFPETGILIIVNTGAGRGADLTRKPAVTYVNCGKAEPEIVAKWIYITLKRAGVASSVLTCTNIAEWCLCDMARVSVETRKIIDYKGGGELTQEEAEELIYKDAEYRVYEMNNAVAYGNYDKFCTVVDELMGKGSDEMAILNGLLSYVRNLITAHYSKDSDSRLAKVLKMKEYGAKKCREQASRMGGERLCYLEKLIYSQISDIKSGQNSPKNALAMVENGIFFANK